MTSSRFGAVLFVLVSGCLTQAPGTSVEISVVDASAIGAGSFVHERAMLGVTKIELVGCSVASIDPVRELIAFLTPIRTAHAHARDFSLATTARSERMEAGAPERVIEVQSPPAGSYCMVRFGLGASEDVDEAVAVEGRLNGELVRVATRFHVDLERTFDPPLVLDEDSISANVVFQIQPARWLDGITREQIEVGGIELDRQLVRNVHETTTIVVE